MLIDCICIIQDDKDDWQREAATMASIAHAELTIAALWCNSVGQSLFSSRDDVSHASTNMATVDECDVLLRRIFAAFYVGIYG
jgi:hypothetical protein